LSEKGKTTLESWYLDYARSRKDMPAPDDMEAALNEVWERLSDEKGSIPQEKPFFRKYYWLTRVGIAASLLLMAGVWVFMSPPPSPDRPAVLVTSVPADNSHSKAYLTLSDGRKIDLERHNPGILIQEGALSFIKTKEGELVYRKDPPVAEERLSWSNGLHEVSTPKAGEYMIELPDETKVWLNAGSTLRFPPVFDERERIVEIKGEAYFEVSKSVYRGQRVPFKVKSGHQVIEVLGTQFNINSYADEQTIKTTLVEGSIRVNFTNDAHKEILLKPGQQLQYIAQKPVDATSPETVQLNVSKVNPRSAVAWKEGYFRFDNVSLDELMRQICRWYNMEVEYKGIFTKHEFVGEIERSAPLTEVLAILEVGSLSFRIEGNTIIVTNEPEEI